MRSIPVTAFAGLGLASRVARQEAECTREFLKEATAAYLAAQKAGDPALFTQLTSSANYTENFTSATASTGILASALAIDFDKSLYDTTQCATFTEIIVTDASHPYVIGSQIWYEAGEVSLIETLVTDQGDWLFNAANTLKYAQGEDWFEIPEAERDTREVIQAGADAYLDIFNDKSVVVPWGTPCARLEGGMYTGNGSPSDRCDVGIPNGVALVNRRYVIDEVVGSVDVFLNFGGPTGIPDSHEFRVEGGKLRFVHTITVMD
ncbi:uncharacterized protein DNG_05103 [Cephalotrichum gorgonifer]|uniref:DUF8021 domain-containing protein n=1 Tax=Cephalotrichum gorgonifer TaxID=2041049 RepID=A0AAE8SV68_9PEZI|nr:uncharacterized protein DNG_05103 [Cephalotrichum gorgonifer]